MQGCEATVKDRSGSRASHLQQGACRSRLHADLLQHAWRGRNCTPQSISTWPVLELQVRHADRVHALGLPL